VAALADDFDEAQVKFLKLCLDAGESHLRWTKPGALTQILAIIISLTRLCEFT
jgi:alkyl hydroperoxide reductase subunit AhpC